MITKPKGGRVSVWLGGAFLLILLALFFVGGIRFSQLALRGNLFGRADDVGFNEALLDEARGIIQQNFVDQEAVTTERLQNGALAGMVDILGDTGHSRFMTPTRV